MAWDPTLPTNSGLLINAPAQIRANWDALVLGTDANLLTTNAKVSPTAAIVESKLLFSGTGHGHTGSTDGKQIVLTTAVSGTLPTANGGTGATANANAASGVVVLDASSKLPTVDGSQLTGVIPLKIENRTDDPGSPVAGQIWIRTDL